MGGDMAIGAYGIVNRIAFSFSLMIIMGFEFRYATDSRL